MKKYLQKKLALVLSVMLVAQFLTFPTKNYAANIPLENLHTETNEIMENDPTEKFGVKFEGENQISAPIASIDSSVPLIDGIKLTLHNVENASIYYTTDGSVPSIDSLLFDEENPIEVNFGPHTNFTVKAVAVLDEKSSEVSVFVYQKAEITSSAKAKKMEDGTQISVRGIATYSIQNRSIYIQDDSGGLVVDGGSNSNLQSWLKKEILVTGTLGNYGGVKQIQPIKENYILALADASDSLTPEKIDLEQLMTREYESKLIQVEDLEITFVDKKATTKKLGNHKIKQGNHEVVLRSFKLNFKLKDRIDIVGVAGFFNENVQILSNTEDITKSNPPIIDPITSSFPTESAILINETVILQTNTKDAKISYQLNDQEWIDANQNRVEILVDAFNQENNTAVIQAIARWKDHTSEKSTFRYRQKQVEVVSASPFGGKIKANTEIELFTQPTDATIMYQLTTNIDTNPKSEEEKKYDQKIVAKEDMFPFTIKAYATCDRYVKSEEVIFTYSLQKEGEARNYFGQLHSHTRENSDGSGTLKEAYDHARDVAKLDFFAVTDHSNSFDKANPDDPVGVFNLGDYNKNNTQWQNGLKAAKDALRDNFVSIYGYEMTWSGGPGHMNTFNTEGFVSRNNKVLNQKTNDAGLKAYYELLKQTPNSISMFNHPGKTFGNFSDFKYYDPVIDERITLIEVGNGEGAVGSGAYFRSYEQFDLALDKGWHVAPANNQDNHRGKWGDANTCRTVIYTNDLSVEGLYTALRERKVYATEDNNLDIYYTLNEESLGTIIEEVPQKAVFKVSAHDPDVDDTIKSMSIITNGGKILHEENFHSERAELNYELNNPNAGYYYIKIIQDDGEIAVTAPVWLGQAPLLGITDVRVSTNLPVTNELFALKTEIFNHENRDVLIKSIRYAIENGDVLSHEELNYTLLKHNDFIHEQKLLFEKSGILNILVTVIFDVDGEEIPFEYQLKINIRDAEKIVFIGIDGSHFNEYVTGHYNHQMGNFAELAASYDVMTIILQTEEELMLALQNPRYKMMILTVPSRRDKNSARNPYKNYKEEEIQALREFSEKGSTIVVSGWSDFYEKYDGFKHKPLEDHMSSQQNKILKAIGSSLRVSDDGSLDDKRNGGKGKSDPARLFLTEYHDFQSPLLKGVTKEQIYSHYGGSSIYAANKFDTPLNELPKTVIPIVSGHASTYSKDHDGDGYVYLQQGVTIPRYGEQKDEGYEKGRLLLAAQENVLHDNGNEACVVVTGAAFMSNYEIKAELDNAFSLNYSNFNILSNLISNINPPEITEIKKVKKGAQGQLFFVEGIATTNSYKNSDDNTGFYDCIYVQDVSGGINLFPVTQKVEAGQKIQVLGTLDVYRNEQQLKVKNIQVIDENKVSTEATVLSTKNSNDPIYTGSLIQTSGKIAEIKKSETIVKQITINDGSGPVIIYLDNYITPNKTLDHLKINDTIRVIGIASIGEIFDSNNDDAPRIRIRDRNEIIRINSNDDYSGSSDDDDDMMQKKESITLHGKEINVNDNQITLPTKEKEGRHEIILREKELSRLQEEIKKLKKNFVIHIESPSAYMIIPADFYSTIPYLNSYMTQENLKKEQLSYQFVFQEERNNQNFLEQLQNVFTDKFSSAIDFQVYLLGLNDIPIAKISVSNRPIRKGILMTEKDEHKNAYFLEEQTKKLGFAPHLLKKIEHLFYMEINSCYYGLFTIGNDEPMLSDVPIGYWARPFIEKTIAKKIIRLPNPSTVEPKHVVSTKEITETLLNIFQHLLGPNQKQLTTKLEEKLGKDIFSTSSMSREEMAVLIHEFIATVFEAEAKDLPIHFTDYDSIDPSYEPSIRFVVSHQLMIGVEEGRFAPKEFVTRAQLATAIYHILNVYHMIEN